jgi:hypothetical protein
MSAHEAPEAFRDNRAAFPKARIAEKTSLLYDIFLVISDTGDGFA